MGVIEIARINKELSRAQLATILGVTRQTIHNWEKKKRTPPLKKMEQLSKELNVSTSKIMKDYM